jgi:hypothetical protein
MLIRLENAAIGNHVNVFIQPSSYNTFYVVNNITNNFKVAKIAGRHHTYDKTLLAFADNPPIGAWHGKDSNLTRVENYKYLDDIRSIWLKTYFMCIHSYYICQPIINNQKQFCIMCLIPLPHATYSQSDGSFLCSTCNFLKEL